MKAVRCMLGLHKWTAWRYVYLPSLYHLSTGKQITGPCDQRECQLCNVYQSREPSRLVP